MNSPSSPNDRDLGRSRSHAGYAAAEDAWVISADIRQCAQEADAGMTQDEWEYAPTSLKSASLPVAESKHLRP